MGPGYPTTSAANRTSQKEWSSTRARVGPVGRARRLPSRPRRRQTRPPTLPHARRSSVGALSPSSSAPSFSVPCPYNVLTQVAIGQEDPDGESVPRIRSRSLATRPSVAPAASVRVVTGAGGGAATFHVLVALFVAKFPPPGPECPGRFPSGSRVSRRMAPAVGPTEMGQVVSVAPRRHGHQTAATVARPRDKLRQAAPTRGRFRKLLTKSGLLLG